MRKLLLIQPKYENAKLDRNMKTIFPNGLGYLAAYVPADWDVAILDEQMEPIRFDLKADVVGISTTTLTANRAYAIANEFRKRGVTVFLGGVHASVLPEEALAYADAVCIGDGEEVIGEMLRDFAGGTLRRTYQNTPPTLAGLKMPRRDLFKPGYTFMPLSTSRGCPFRCTFCAIHRFYNGTYRKRDVEDVVAEFKALPHGSDIVFVTDGNMYGYLPEDAKRFKDICRRLVEERRGGGLPFKYFTCYGSINALDDEEALDLAHDAGCIALLVGFESINPDSLKDMNKVMNLRYGVDSYARLVEKAKQKRIMIVGEMMVGNDSDDLATLAATERFVETIGFDILRLQIVQPLPGTKLFEKLQQEGRLFLKNFPEDWNRLRDGFLVGVNFQLKQLEARALQQWVKRVGLRFYSPGKILRRGWRNWRLTGNWRFGVMTTILNWKSRRTYANIELD